MASMSTPLLQRVTLEGRHVRLEPLDRHHVDPLAEVGLDPDIWLWSPEPVRTRADIRAYVEAALDGRRLGTMLPFATVLRDGDTVVGSTRFGAIDLRHRRVEVGWTWVAPTWQRTAVNTEAKLLMLAHAFEVLGCQRVELKTDALNERSRNAIIRLGALQEGFFRKHMVTASGRVRDSVYFSIVDDEWPQVRARLEAKLAEHDGSASPT
jgi:N-acetyltransferase